MTRIMPARPEWLRAEAAAPAIGVDRQHNVIRGYVVAQLGPFKTPGRGEFDQQSLATIHRLMAAAPAGLKSRFAHPTLSEDGLGKFLGRSKNPVLEPDRVRADLHLDPSSFATPGGDLGTYLMDLAESDAAALSSSLVLRTDKELRLKPDGTRQKDPQGEPLPPLWRPTQLHASDIVDTGDAVDGLLSSHLSIDHLPDAAVRRGMDLLDQVFGEQPVDVVRERLAAWLDRYLAYRFGEAANAAPRPHNRELLEKMLDLKAQTF